VNADDPAAMALASATRAQRCDFALETLPTDGVGIEAGSVVQRRGGRSTPLLPLSAVHLPGRHLLADVLASAAAATSAGASAAALHAAVERFRGLEHALEFVGELDGVRFVNDSKATNVLAARRAIESFDRDLVVIIGGRYKGGSFADLRDPLRMREGAAVAIGEAQIQVEEALSPAVPVRRAGSMSEAVRIAYGLAPRGGVVLLAPACSSFDMFEDYSARGRAFKREFGRLATERGALT
jgi:UDP-N-acetylmuramoylalanine--D-glutamate ligase